MKNTDKIAVRRESAAALLDISLDSFDRYVRPEVPAIRRGRVLLFLVEDLRQWAQRNVLHLSRSDG